MTQDPQDLTEAPRQLRSRGVNIIQTSPTVLNFSKRALCHASPLVWYNLPQSVISDITVTTNTFKNRLKCALYSRAFLQWHMTLPHLRFFTYSEWYNVCLNHIITIIIIKEFVSSPKTNKFLPSTCIHFVENITKIYFVLLRHFADTQTTTNTLLP